MKFARKGHTLFEMLVVAAVFMLMMLGFVRVMTFQGRMLARSRTQQTLQHQASYALRHIRKHVAGAATINLEAGDADENGKRPVSRIELIGLDGTLAAAYVLTGSELSYGGDTIADKVDGFFTRSQETQDLRKFDLEVITGDEVAGYEMTLSLVAPVIATRVEPAFAPPGVVKNQTLFEFFQSFSPSRIDEAFYSSIQEAIDDARQGDELRAMGNVGMYAPGKVHDGVFNENVVIRMDLELKGGYDAKFEIQDVESTPTVIDAGGNGRVVEAWIRSGSLLIDGFTIRNGYIEGSYAGVYTLADNDASIMVSNNIIRGNRAPGTNGFDGQGGGMFAWTRDTAHIEVVGNTIEWNEASYGGGGIQIVSGSDISNRPAVEARGNVIFRNNAGRAGGVCISGTGKGTIVIRNNTIRKNRATGTLGTGGSGGGIRASTGGEGAQSDGSVVFIGNIVELNTGGHRGGGMDLLALPGTSIDVINGNIIHGNDASNCGGIALQANGVGTHVLIDGNFIRGNIAEDNTGGVGAHIAGDAFVRISHNVIEELPGVDGNPSIPNEARSGDGGGIYVYSCCGASIQLDQNTVSNSRAGDSGGGIYAWAVGNQWFPGSSIVITDNTVTGNHAPNGGGGVHSRTTKSAYASVTFVPADNTIVGNTANNFQVQVN